ncbi:hypothetical protein [Euryhalocaulis caribicus]|uniref:hypothetical protein n=1 Tax=Euryhalocaulis caribicus TaxID=1161401 RepID=UPI001269464C|nr:hypothetical protein [Euryhalocaulis caribicus]
MTTPSELLIQEEVTDLEANAAAVGWKFQKLDSLQFVLGVKTKDASWLYVRCEPENYPTKPPAWRWCNSDGNECDELHVTARGGNFFHSSGVICAPWNRLAYKSEDSRGPHSDWDIGAWVENEKTRQCRTLSAMASRIAIEALTKFEKRKG